MEEFQKEKEGLILPENVSTKRSLGLILPSEAEINDPENAAKMAEIYRQLNMDRATLPASYSSVEKGLVTPAKNQRECGSCAAFAATGLHESCMLQAGASKAGLDLSEQYLIDCAYDKKNNNGCNGAALEKYSQWFVKNGGMAAHEAKYPYLNRNPLLHCGKAKGKEWNSGAKVVSTAHDFQADAEKLKALLVKYGAVAVALNADTLSPYKGGIFDKCTLDAKPNHAVLLVGYGTEKGVDYWLVKNSWGANWGEKGFFRIKRGQNTCAMEKLAAVTTCTKSGKAAPAPPVPTPKPVPANMKCDISGLYGKGINGNYRFDTTINGKLIVSEVKCEDSICTPLKPGPSNACMYICGKLKCTRGDDDYYDY